MTDRPERTPGPPKAKRKGGIFPALCTVLGNLIILAVVLLLLPMSAARAMGYQVFNVVSGSMAPAIPKGSLVLVRPVSAWEIGEGEVIAFARGGSVVTHRVTAVHDADSEFVTKGDANTEEDILPVPFSALIGRVERHVPVLGALAAMAAGSSGKLILFAQLLAGILLRLLGDRLRRKSGEV